MLYRDSKALIVLINNTKLDHEPHTRTIAVNRSASPSVVGVSLQRLLVGGPKPSIWGALRELLRDDEVHEYSHCLYTGSNNYGLSDIALDSEPRVVAVRDYQFM